MAGRPKGVPNRATKARESIIAEHGITPLAFMLKTLRDEEQPFPTRFEAAKAAAPYVHPRLQNIEANVTAKVSLYDWLLKPDAETDGEKG